MSGQSFQYLINERKKEMIFSGSLIQSAVINAYAPPNNNPSRNELIMVILDDSHATLFRNYLN